jgi:putative ABC transport system substrate-binding protein
VFFVAWCTIFILTLTFGILVAQRAAAAPQPVKVHRIGVLMFTSPPSAIEELRQGLHELGYMEGRNLTLEVRSAEGRFERLADLAAELVRLPVDLIVAHTNAAVREAQRATTTLPIVAAVMTDPEELGLVESLAHPGGNITGSFAPRLELQAKRLELLKEALPGVTRVAVFLAEGTPGRNQGWLKVLEHTARELGVELHPVEVSKPDDVESALSAIAHGQAEALVVSDASLLGLHAKQIGDFVVEHHLPTIGASKQPSYLMAYWVRGDFLWRRTAVFIDKILKGTRPGDLPMERAYKFWLLINLKTAKALGITMPPSLLVLADEGSNEPAKFLKQSQGRCTKNARILLVNLLQSSRSTFSRGNLLSFFAFQEGMLGTPISVLGGWPTVSARFSYT